MNDLIFLGQTSIFFAALGVAVILCGIEACMLFFGGGSFDLPDNDVATENSEAGPLGYLNIGRLPFTLFASVACAVFGISGLAIYHAQFAVLGTTLPLYLSLPLTTFASIPGVRWASKGVGAILPRTETTALSVAGFIGLTATITLGEAKRGSPAQAKLRDQFGQTHYLMVEPARTNEILVEGQSVLLTQKQAAIYFATAQTTTDA